MRVVSVFLGTIIDGRVTRGAPAPACALREKFGKMPSRRTPPCPEGTPPVRESQSADMRWLGCCVDRPGGGAGAGGDDLWLDPVAPVAEGDGGSDEHRRWPPCRMLEVGGLVGRASCANGLYEEQSSQRQHGRPVFVQTTSPGGAPARLCYDTSAGTPAWLVEVPDDPGHAYAYAEGDATTPDAAVDWQLWVCWQRMPIESGVWYEESSFPAFRVCPALAHAEAAGPEPEPETTHEDFRGSPMVRTQTARSAASANKLDALGAELAALQERFGDLDDGATSTLLHRTLLAMQVQLEQLDSKLDVVPVSGLTAELPLRYTRTKKLEQCEKIQHDITAKLRSIQDARERPHRGRSGPTVQSPSKAERQLDDNLDQLNDKLAAINERATAALLRVEEAVADHQLGYSRKSTATSLSRLLQSLLNDLDDAIADLQHTEPRLPPTVSRSPQGHRHTAMTKRGDLLTSQLREGIDELAEVLVVCQLATADAGAGGTAPPRVPSNSSQWSPTTVNAVLASGSTSGGAAAGGTPHSLSATDTPTLAWRDDETETLERSDSAHRRLTGLFGVDPADFDPQYDFDFTEISEREDRKKEYWRGGQRYYRPCGWKRLALDVKEKYWPQDCTIAELKQVLAATRAHLRHFTEKAEMVCEVQTRGLGGKVQQLVNARIGDWLGESGHPGEWCNGYHGTSAQVAKHITRQGFRRGGSGGVDVANGATFGPGVYCTPQAKEAELYAQGAEVIADVDGVPTTKHYEVIVLVCL
eukprot:COSAG02_NODE_2769_length_8063_cov_2.501130_3_plen_756_part_00